jgi:hypothetical protein
MAPRRFPPTDLPTTSFHFARVQWHSETEGELKSGGTFPHEAIVVFSALDSAVLTAVVRLVLENGQVVTDSVCVYRPSAAVRGLTTQMWGSIDFERLARQARECVAQMRELERDLARPEEFKGIDDLNRRLREATTAATMGAPSRRGLTPEFLQRVAAIARENPSSPNRAVRMEIYGRQAADSKSAKRSASRWIARAIADGYLDNETAEV